MNLGQNIINSYAHRTNPVNIIKKESDNHILKSDNHKHL